MDGSPLGDVLAAVWTLAKEIGKGGGGSTEEPTVCMSLLPVGLGLLVVGVGRLRRRLGRVYFGRLEAGRPLRSRVSPERKVQTA